MKKLLPVVIDRSRWLRGEGPAESTLLRKSDRKMCCLGFAALCLGAHEQQIIEKRAPADATCVRWPDQMMRRRGLNPRAVGDLMTVNDYSGLAEESRESQVKVLGEECGFAFTFVDGNAK